MAQTKALLQEAVVVLTIFTPALFASLGIILLMKATCGILWHSRCQTRMLGMHHLDETMLVARVDHAQQIIWTRKKATRIREPRGSYLGD